VCKRPRCRKHISSFLFTCVMFNVTELHVSISNQSAPPLTSFSLLFWCLTCNNTAKHNKYVTRYPNIHYVHNFGTYFINFKPKRTLFATSVAKLHSTTVSHTQPLSRRHRRGNWPRGLVPALPTYRTPPALYYLFCLHEPQRSWLRVRGYAIRTREQIPW
jgi:hypothetical protein